jgi:hypothetical protein
MPQIMRFVFTALLVMGLGGAPATADDEVEWYKVFNVKLKPGKFFEADNFVKQYLTPADEKIGRKVVTFVYQTGAWDRVSYFPAEMTEQGIDTIPSEKVWWDAFVAQEGSEEKAAARMAEFMDMVAVFETEIAKPQQ